MVGLNLYRTPGHRFVENANPSLDLEAPIVTIISPNGGEPLTVGTAYDVTWGATDNVAATSVGIYYSENGGASFTSGSCILNRRGSYAHI